VTFSHKELFERYIYAGAITHNADAVAALFTEDGVYEAPLLPDGHRLPRRLDGREAIRVGVAAFHDPAHQGTVDYERTGYVLHETADPDVFIAEIDAVVNGTTMSLVQLFRLRDGQIALLRDYFAIP
jgi:ketosteroid isomerase-like protein